MAALLGTIRNVIPAESRVCCRDAANGCADHGSRESILVCSARSAGRAALEFAADCEPVRMCVNRSQKRREQTVLLPWSHLAVVRLFPSTLQGRRSFLQPRNELAAFRRSFEFRFGDDGGSRRIFTIHVAIAVIIGTKGRTFE